jgi:hypothetical protein
MAFLWNFSVSSDLPTESEKWWICETFSGSDFTHEIGMVFILLSKSVKMQYFNGLCNSLWDAKTVKSTADC